MTKPPLPAWCDAAPDAAFTDPVDCAAQASKFERTVSRRNLFEYLACAFVIGVFGFGAFRAAGDGDTLMAFALLSTVIGAVVVAWGLWKRASNLVRRAEDACLVHLRRQFEHQNRALRAVPLWYLGPLVPGLALFYFAEASGVAEQAGWLAGIEEIALRALISVLIFAAIAYLNHWAAKSIERKIEELDSLA
ncbi:MAG: hypothetical protein QNJ15_13075 [Erythrobacter sp.]|nr:hypothetical protein [Erythrobacter sp.]